MNPGPSRQGPFRALLPLVLASASPRRQALLAGQGLGFEVVPSTLKEPAPEPGEAPAEYAARMARIKGQDIAARHPDKVIVSADTIVVQDSSILGKPKDAEDALDMLTALAGRWHEVMTGFCVLRHGDGVSLCRTVTTRVHMADNSREMLQAYIGTGEPMDKAGAYAVQGTGACLVAEVHGSWTGVVGLPLSEVVGVLVRRGVIGLRGKE